MDPREKRQEEDSNFAPLADPPTPPDHASLASSLETRLGFLGGDYEHEPPPERRGHESERNNDDVPSHEDDPDVEIVLDGKRCLIRDAPRLGNTVAL